MKLPFFSLLNIILEGKSSTRFLIGAVGSFSFSIAVILCTVGLMDGFESTLVKSLQRSSGDLLLTSRDGFFSLDQKFNKIKEVSYIKEITPIIQVEAFFIYQDQSRGVLVKGIEPKSFRAVAGLEMNLKQDGVAIGESLGQSLGLGVGDEIVLTFASNSKTSQGSPILKTFKVLSIVKHGVFEKDMRYIYIHRENLLRTLSYSNNTANMALIKLDIVNDVKKLNDLAFDLETKIDESFRVQTFWEEFKTLLDAVEIEKFSITVILQLIVVVAIFNIIAFIIFISEKKAQELFLLRALGLSVRTLIGFWYRLLFSIWGISAGLSVGLTFIFNYLLMNLPFFKLPGDIYVLSRLKIELEVYDYLIVFGLALLWIFVLGFLSLLKLKNKTLLHSLRQEFS